jgi:hypothetical protein
MGKHATCWNSCLLTKAAASVSLAGILFHVAVQVEFFICALENVSLCLYRVIEKSHNPFLTHVLRVKKINYIEIRKQKTMLY